MAVRNFRLPGFVRLVGQPPPTGRKIRFRLREGCLHQRFRGLLADQRQEHQLALFARRSGTGLFEFYEDKRFTVWRNRLRNRRGVVRQLINRSRGNRVHNRTPVLLGFRVELPSVEARGQWRERGRMGRKG
jgi:hypothetical protein